MPWEVVRIRPGPEGKALINRISAFVRVTRKLAATSLCFPSCENIRNPSMQPGRGFSLEPDPTGILISDFQPLEL